VGFREAVRTLVSSSLPGVKEDMGPVEGVFGNFRPMMTYGNGEETVIFDAMMGQEEVGKIPALVKSCQEARVSGTLNLVIDDLTVYRYLPRLVLVEEYCKRSPSLKFQVKLHVLDEKKRKLIPIMDISPALKNSASSFKIPSAPY
jgi:hypothetical protein